MQESERGRQLAEQYREIGPPIVLRINAYKNRRSLWNYLYNTLVCKSIGMIEKGEKEQAMNYYAAYVKGLDDLLQPSDENLNDW